MYEHSPLLKAVMQNIEKYSDKAAVVMNGNTVSYGDLGKNIRKAAGVLKSMGIHAGDRIILSAHENLACGFGVGLAWGSAHFMTDHLKAIELMDYEY